MENTNNIDTENYDNINFENVCEVYSNEDKHIEIINQINIDESKKIPDITKIENIIKNINKYKLPELQDIAIKYNINLSNNNKKKTKGELINDIKIYFDK